MNFNERLSDNYKNLSDSDRFIGQYVLENRNHVITLSIDELAKICSVSRSTIMRFSQKLGLSGYSELKALLKIENKTVSYPTNDLVNFVCNNNIDTIKLFQKMNLDAFSELLLNAKRIFVYGTGFHQRTIVHELRRIFLGGDLIIHEIAGESEFRAMLPLLNAYDLIFMISYTGDSDFTKQIVNDLRLRDIKIVSLTRSKNNYLSSNSVSSIFVPIENIQLPNNKSIEPLTVMFSVIEIIFFKFIEYKQKVDHS